MSDDLFRLYRPDECSPKDGYPFQWHRTIKHLVRKEAGNRCLRCGHPYQKGLGEWSPCDTGCDHGGPIRVISDNGPALEPDIADNPLAWLGGVHIERVEARWRVLTVHHLDNVKENCNWWNLVPLCQRDHLVVQRRVVMKRAWPWEHSSWFKPYAAAYYAFEYLNYSPTREEAIARMDEWLALGMARAREERMPV